MKPINQQAAGPLREDTISHDITYAKGTHCLRNSAGGFVTVGGWEADTELMRLAYSKMDAAARELGVDACELLKNVDLVALLVCCVAGPIADYHERVEKTEQWLVANLPKPPVKND